MAFALWFMSMDLTPLIYGSSYDEAQGYQVVAACFRARHAGRSAPGDSAHGGGLRVLGLPLRHVRFLGVGSPCSRAEAS